ncbi:AAA family ATPase [Acinetobacter baumannii]|uniref:AAA family ATPase n=1 Tax=Acinetobacter baumannii TaxID=470 RepID=UPI00044CE3E4|nr:AAA family ATPase [Acinetobacter baumannii]EXR19094.1 recF/RecN/SMC N terminal domain protein [Acinetobacter baumannii 1295549]EXR90036.1 recF/RecN/SMC N terminal domain protein [Acinetobacter baumannii 277047]EXS35660.1 recF/RecN/SMC N terminal domain protein [Acinetobacter baumannii 426863]
MKILKATFQNFLTLSEACLELDDRGLLLITGKNDDDTSANSNGAGKSSLVDGICWALYGTTARDVSGDDVVNETAKKDCCVSLQIEDDGKLYNITRYRKSKKFKNALIVSSVDKAGVETNLTKGTDKETQLLVNAIVGCSADVFTSAVYAGQERMPDLPSMTDKTLKMLIEEAAGIEVLEAAHAIARKNLNEAKLEHSEALHKVSLIDAHIANVEASLLTVEKQSLDFEITKKDRAKEHLKLCLPHLATIRECEAQLDLESPAKEIEQINEQIEQLKEIQKQHTAKSLELRKIYVDFNARVHLAKVEKQNIEKLKAEIANSQSLVGTPCNECGKQYCAEDLHDAIQARETLLKSKIKQNNEIILKAREIDEQRKNLEAEISELEDQLKQLPTLQAKLEKLKQDAQAQSLAEERKKIAEEAVARIKAESREKLNEVSPFVAQLKDLNDKKVKYLKAREDKQKAADSALEKVELANMAVNIFGPAGVRAHILDTVTPFLNSRTSEYLGALSDGNIHATWSTLSATAKGELKEKFSIMVANDSGGSSFKKLSGGEKRKVRLATALALQDLVMSRATKPINLWIADEIDYALDESGLERLMVVLDRKARERGTVLIISHQSGLKDWVDLVIEVTKKEGTSTVSGDNLKAA